MATEEEKKAIELAVRVSILKEDVDRMGGEMRKSVTYTHNMLEDLIHRMAKIEVTAARFETNLIHVNGNGATTQTALAGIDNRMRTLERMAWGSIGGLTVFAGIFTFFGWKVIQMTILSAP